MGAMAAAAKALANFSIGMPDFHGEMLDNGIHIVLLGLVRSGSIIAKENAARTLAAIMSAHRDHCQRVVDADGVVPLTLLLSAKNAAGLAAEPDAVDARGYHYYPYNDADGEARFTPFERRFIPFEPRLTLY